MTRTITLTLALLLGAGSAYAQAIDCSGGCSVTKYGTTHPEDFDFRRPPNNPVAFTEEDFTGSYFFIRANPANPGGIDCGGGPRDFTPVVGQVLLREQDGCVPTETEGCPVEIPQDVPGLEGQSLIYAGIWSKVPGLFDLLSTTPFGVGQTGDPGDPTCQPDSIRTTPAQGVRFVLPAARGGDGVKTYIHWNESPETGLFRGGGEGGLCCNSTTNTFCDFLGGFFEYPVLFEQDCSVPQADIFPLALTPDWIFEGGAGTDFITDSDFELPDQKLGVCRVNRRVGCDQRPPPETLGDPCPDLDADPDTPGLQPDECDFREPGMRSTRPANQSNGFPNPLACGGSFYVLQASAQQNCFLMDNYEAPGDPGEDCLILNFGLRPRADLDCDGVADGPDLCPFLNEFDPLANSDFATGGDAATGPLGDECECGDQTRDGFVDVNDILGANAAIFNPALEQTTCDATGDVNCNIDDILAINREIFVPGTAVCREITPLSCGDGVLDAAVEECDDGNRESGDGCDGACRSE
jgi:cysteine-rich repeat protein